MKKLILVLLVCLIPFALSAQTVSPTSTAPVQDRSASPAQAELEEVEKLNASLMQLYAAGNYKEALLLAERVLMLREKVHGDADPRVGSALENLAVLYLALNKFEKAESGFERILARREKSRSATSPATMNMLIKYRCLTIARSASNQSQVAKLTDRINSILLQDAVLAAGLSLPEDLAELNSRLVFTKPQPRYPGEAKSARLQGTVLVWGEADETGKIVKAEAIPCWQGQKLLADAGVEAMRAARLKPISINNQAIKLKVITTYSFVLR
ncbi:MAG TPA: tetratricopeptide repeat protein [Pyrinomonadaceae bacterium]|nr:tetratricopeptide repeat protein [Pyrinomonadaceae bacterium]